MTEDGINASNLKDRELANMVVCNILRQNLRAMQEARIEIDGLRRQNAILRAKDLSHQAHGATGALPLLSAEEVLNIIAHAAGMKEARGGCGSVDVLRELDKHIYGLISEIDRRQPDDE